MGYIAKNLVKIAKGYHLEQNIQHQKVMLRSCKMTATLLLTHYVLQIPTIQQKLEALKLPLYDGQRSNVDKWTVKQRLAFLIGVGQGITPSQWATQFQLSERTIKTVYNDLGLSIRLKPSLFVSRKVEVWEHKLWSAWNAQNIPVADISNRLCRHPVQIAKQLNLEIEKPPFIKANFVSKIICNGQIDFKSLCAELKSLALDWQHAQHPTHDSHFILRSLHSTYPLVLAGTILQLCEPELKVWWTWMIREPVVPLNFHRLRWLEALSRTGDLPEVEYSKTQCKQDLQRLGVRFNPVRWCLRQGVPFEQWETDLCEEWVGTISLSTLSKRLLRPIDEFSKDIQAAYHSNPVSEIEENPKPDLEQARPNHKVLLSNLQPSKRWTAVEASNLCKKCRRAVISPPFESCLHCLLRHPSPKYNPRLALEKVSP